MARFKQLQVKRDQAYAVGSPVVISAAALLADNKEKTLLAQVKFTNVGSKTIAGLVAEYTPLAAMDRPLDAIVHQYRCDSIEPGSDFAQDEPVSLPIETVDFTTRVLRVIFSDETTWDAPEDSVWEKLPLQETLSEAIGSGELLDQYVISVGKGLQYAPLALGEGSWLCGCGSVNGPGRLSCISCGIPLEAQQHHLDESLLRTELNERLEEARKEAEEQARLDAERKEKEEEEERKRRAEEEERRKAKEASRKKAIRATAIVAAAIGAILIGVFVYNSFIVPANAYNHALSLMESGDYEGAISAFEGLGDYKDSPDQVQNAKTAKALALIESGDTRGALNVLWELKNAGAQTEAVVDALLASAEQLAHDGDFEKAYDLASSLSHYTNTDELIKSYATSAGDVAKGKGDYYAAVEWYKKAGDVDLVLEAKYGYVKSNFNHENSLTYEYLSELKDAGYLDSAALYEDLYAWHVDLDDIYFEEGRNGTGYCYLRYRISGGEPGAELSFHFEFSSSGNMASDGYLLQESGSYEYTISLDNFKRSADKANDGGYATLKIENSAHPLTYRLIPSLYSNLEVTVTVTANGETLSETINVV